MLLRPSRGVSLRLVAARYAHRGAGKKSTYRPKDKGQSNEPDVGTLQRYHSFWLRLLEVEHGEEERLVHERLRNWPISRLRQAGFVITGLTAAKRLGNNASFSRDIVRFTLPLGSYPRQHSFDVGDEAILSRDGPLTAHGTMSKDAVPCEILQAGSDSIRVTVEPSAAAVLWSDSSEIPWRLDRMANSVAHSRTCRALKEWSGRACLASATLRRTVIEGSHASGASSLAEDPLRPLAAAQQQPMLSFSPAMNAAYLKAASMSLNLSQQHSVLSALRAFGDASLGKADAPLVSLIQGPPGTGKSTAAVGLLKLASMFADGPLLAAADSNAATDNLLEGLLKQGIKACRIGRSSRASPALVASTLEAQLEAHPEFAGIRKQREQLHFLRAAAKDQPRFIRLETEQVVREGSAQLRSLEQSLTRRILNDHEVIVSTLVGCGAPALLVPEPMRFPLVVVDECTQATEPRTLLALSRAASSVVLVGDQKQLAPTCISQEAAAQGLSRSLFERLALAAPRVPSIQFGCLTIQYRMHPALRAFPSSQFYQGLLEDGVSAADRVPPRAFPSPTRRPAPEVSAAAGVGEHRHGAQLGEGGCAASRDGASAATGSVHDAAAAPASAVATSPSARSPLAFFDLQWGHEERGRHGESKLNRLEARCIAKVAQALLADVAASDLGVITPYRAQAAEIRRRLRADGISPEVEVNTVDGFQGREKDAILFSAVRSNAKGRVGFLGDARRLNVGLTRARRALFVVGNQRTLSQDPNWGAFLAHCKANDRIVSEADLNAFGIYLREPAREAHGEAMGEAQADGESAALGEGR